MYKNINHVQQFWRLVSLIEICFVILWLPIMAMPAYGLLLGIADSGKFDWGRIITFLAMAFSPPLLSVVSFLGIRKFQRWGYITAVVAALLYINIYLLFFVPSFWKGVIEFLALFIPKF